MGWLSRKSDSAARPQIGEGKRVYAVGDIHGRRDLLDNLLEQIFSDAEAAPQLQKILVFLGDYVDRGIGSKRVLERLIGLDLPDWQLVFLRGNHDQAVLDFLSDANFYRAWRTYGAPETLLSYGVMPPQFDRDEDFAKARDAFAKAVPAEHVQFLQNLEYHHIIDDYIFVHAGIRPGIPITEQLPEDFMWIRDEFLSYRRALPKMVVHGHTPSPQPVKTSNRIGVDTGAHATHFLTAVVLEEGSHRFLQTSKQKNRSSLLEAARV